MTTLLGFDTATAGVSVALAVADRIWRRDAAGGAQASATLLPTVQALLLEAGVALADVDAIAFGRGPGAFTGVRTACAVAQGLAFGLGCAVLPVDTTLVVAEDARWRAAARAADWSVWALLDARMGELYAAHYRWHGGRWSTLCTPMLATPVALSLAWAESPPRAVAGAALHAFGAALALHGALAVPDAEPAADALLRVAAADLAAGGGLDAALALPLYVRDKVAQTMAERAAAAVAS